MNLKKTYNKIAEDWIRDHESNTWWIHGTDTFISFLAPGASVLDVGCAGGDKSKYLADRGFSLVGIDFSEKMLEIARQKVPDSTFYVVDIRDPFKMKKQFDAIFAQAVLLHIPKNEVVHVLRNLLVHLKTRGYLYIAVKEMKKGHPEEEIRRDDDYGYSYERFFSYFTLTEIKQYCDELGLDIRYERVSPIENTNWIEVIAQKK